MIVKKFQQGGNALPALLLYRPVIATNAADDEVEEDEGGNSSSSSADLTDKDLLKMVKEKVDGLPNDIDAITSELQNFYLDLQYMINPPTANIAARYAGLLGELNRAKFSKDAYDKAYQAVSANDGINEYAIDENGYLFCINKDGTDFRKMTLRLVKNQKDGKYSPMTNAQLLYYRAYRPDLIGNNAIIDVVSHGVGMKSALSLLNDIITGMGSTEISREGLTKTKLGKIVLGYLYIQEASQILGDNNLADAMTVDDMYKAGVMSKDLASQSQYSIQYTLSVLPKNIRTLLEVKAEEYGLNKDGRGVERLVTSLIMSRTSVTNKFDLSTPSEGSSSDGADASDPNAKLKLSPVMMMLSGLTNETSFRIVNGTTAGIELTALQVPIMKDSNTPLGTAATLQDVFNTLFGGSLDSRYITFGGQRINQSQLDNVEVDANNLFVMYLPYDKEVYLATGGLILPDFKFLKKLELVLAELKSKNIDLTNPESEENIKLINNLLKSKGLPVMFNADGTLRVQDYWQFGALSGYAPEQAFEDLDDTEIIAQDVTDINTIKSIERHLNKGRDNKDRISIDSKSFLGIKGTYDHVYKGNIFIPIINNNLNAAIASGVSLTPTQAVDILDRENQKRRLLEHGGYFDGSKFEE